MFPLHERTQRRLCRFAFFGLCLVPTLLVLWWCVSLYWPGERTTLEQQLSQRLGLDVSIGSLEYPRPGVTRLSDVQLVDPSTGRDVARIERVESFWQRNRQVVSLRSPQLNADQLDSLWKLFSESTQIRAGTSTERLQMHSEKVTFHNSALKPIERFAFQLTPNDKGAESTVRFNHASALSGEAVRMQWLRTGRGEHREDRIHVHTGDAELPQSLLAAIIPQITKLGEQCQLRGSLRLVTTGDASHGEWSGSLRDVDLETLTKQHTPYHVHGTADLHFEKLTFTEGRLTAAAGNLSVQDGQISGPLLRSFDRMLSRQKESKFEGQDGLIDYKKWAMDFNVAHEGWTFLGRIPGQEPSVLMTDHASVLLRQSKANEKMPISHAQIAVVLSENPQTWVPLTSRTAWLLNRLPLPKPSAAKATR